MQISSVASFGHKVAAVVVVDWLVLLVASVDGVVCVCIVLVVYCHPY